MEAGDGCGLGDLGPSVRYSIRVGRTMRRVELLFCLHDGFVGS